MIKTRPINGVVPVVSTPFTRDGDIDEQGLVQLMERLVSKDIGGLWVLGTGSEDMNMSFAKRLQVAEIACKTNAGRKPLVLGTGFFAMDDILAFADATKHLEFDGYHVMPYHNLLSWQQVGWFYRHIADNVAKPLWMYTSGNWTKPFTAEFILDMMDHPNIAGVKFSSKDTTAILKVAEVISPEFQMITAIASQFIACLSMGSPAHTSSLGSACPDPMIEIYELFKAGKMDEALQAQFKLNKFLASWPKGGKSNNFLQAAEEKAILEVKGICKRYTSSYYTEMTDDDLVQFRKLLDEYGY